MIVELLARAKDGEGVKSGPIGLAVILLLCVAVYFLFKSMSKHLKKVRDEFPTETPGATLAGPDEPAPSDPTSAASPSPVEGQAPDPGRT